VTDKVFLKNEGKINIAYVLGSEERGGVEEHVLSLVKSVNTSEFRIFVVASPGLIEAFGKDLSETSARVVPIKIRNVFDFSSMKIFHDFLRDNRIDIVNTHMFIASFYYSPVARLANVPILIETSHGVEKWRLEKGFIKRKSFLIDRIYSYLQNRIIAVSRACKNDLISIKGISPEKISVVQNGRNLDDFKPLTAEKRDQLRKQYELTAGDYIFGVMARLDFQKGHKYLFNAVKILSEKRKGFKVMVVGDGILRNDLQCMVKDLGIERFVIFAGFQKDLPGYHGMMDVNILPSLYEGLPLGLIEASAMEIPVIATDVDGTTEVIVDKKTGILVPPKDSASLAGAMLYALDNKDVMRGMGKAGREYVLKQFSLERQIQETELLYKQLMQRPK
jgi:glycosyltransferase involved in cell wall biosynthesis